MHLSPNANFCDGSPRNLLRQQDGALVRDGYGKRIDVAAFLVAVYRAFIALLHSFDQIHLLQLIDRRRE